MDLLLGEINGGKMPLIIDYGTLLTLNLIFLIENKIKQRKNGLMIITNSTILKL